jgi:hypothetical protein
MQNEPPLPIDDSDGGCDTPGDKEHKAWSRETPLLKIEPGDVISDDGHENLQCAAAARNRYGAS